MGRKSTFDPKVAASICEQLSRGIPLAEICRQEGMPATRTVSDWRLVHTDFAADFARARDDGFDAIAADCLRIADDTSQDTMIVGSDEHAREAANTEWISRSKLRVETRLKLLAKWDPKRYGDKMVVAGDPEAPLGAVVSPEVLGAMSQMSPEQLRALASRPIKEE